MKKQPTPDLLVAMNDYGIVSINETIISYGFAGCIAILIKTEKDNILFHIRADNSSLIDFLIRFYNSKRIKKCVQFLPEKSGKYELKPIKIKSKIIRYKPKIFDRSGDIVNFAKLLNIKNSELNLPKSINYLGISKNKFIFHNLILKNYK